MSNFSTRSKWLELQNELLGMGTFWIRKRSIEKIGSNGTIRMAGFRLLMLCIRSWSTSGKKRLMGREVKRLLRSRSLYPQWSTKLLMGLSRWCLHPVLVSDLRGGIEVLMESFKRNDLIQKVEEILIVVNPVEELRKPLSRDAGAVVRLATG